MTQIAFIHIALEIWGCIFCLIAALCSFLEKSLSPKENQLMIQIQIVNAILLGFDCLAWFFRGNISTLGFYMVRISNCMVFLMTTTLIWSITCYIEYFIMKGHEDDRMCRILLQTIYVISIVAVALILISQFTGLYYKFDEQNRYYRTDMYWLSMALGISAMILDLFIVILRRKRLSVIQIVAFLSYIALPILAAIIQTFIYGVQLLNLAITISIMIMFFTFQVERSKKYVEQERELHQAEIGIMMSQIQPHFLYNALLVIQELCHTNPQEAEEATVDFSKFLRGNMDSLSADAPIPFEKEVEHTKHYLALEQRRFGKKLRVEWDLQTTIFNLPVLTLQPIVENAVRYGVTKKKGGGTVTISTEEKKDSVILTVKDDGRGFDITKPKEDGRTHIGIINVKKRVMDMCGGSLEISSVEDIGTTVTIQIPKGGKKFEHYSSR